jgi:predicted PhzF superfamily epimerase YddE/YHI9
MIELAIYQIDAFTHERFKGNPAAVVGDIAVVRREDGLLEMSFPNRAPEPVAEPPQVLLAALNLVPECVLRNRQAWFVVCADEEQVRAATKPDTFSPIPVGLRYA